MSLRQILQLHRLVELYAVLTRDIAQGAGRYIAGQNDDRDLAMKLLPQLRRDLKPVHAVRQIVVGEDEVGSDRSSRHQFQRRDAVGAVAAPWPSSLRKSSRRSRTSGSSSTTKIAPVRRTPSAALVIYAAPVGVQAAVRLRSTGA